MFRLIAVENTSFQHRINHSYRNFVQLKHFLVSNNVLWLEATHTFRNMARKPISGNPFDTLRIIRIQVVVSFNLSV